MKLLGRGGTKNDPFYEFLRFYFEKEEFSSWPDSGDSQLMRRTYLLFFKREMGKDGGRMEEF